MANLAVSSVFGQYENNTWYFGDRILLNLNCNPPIPRTTNLSQTILTGGTHFNDNCGELRFYTNGELVFGANGAPLANGTGLQGSQNHPNGTIFLQHPNMVDSSAFVFLFTASQNGKIRFNRIFTPVTGGPLVFTKDEMLDDSSTLMTLVKHNDDGKYWLVTKGPIDPFFRAYEISLRGIDPNPVISTGPMGASGTLEASPDGKRIALRTPLRLYDFDNRTGRLTDFADLSFANLGNGTWMEFSQSGNALYVQSEVPAIGLYYFNLEHENQLQIINSKTLVDGRPVKGITLTKQGYMLVITEDGSGGVNTRASYMRYPDRDSASLEYISDFVLLGRNPWNGLPNIPSYQLLPREFKINGVCQSAPIQIGLDNKLEYRVDYDSIKWTVDNSKADFEVPADLDDDTIILKFKVAECVPLTATYYLNGAPLKVVTEIIKIEPAPIVNLGDGDTGACNGNIVIDAFHPLTETYAWSTGDATASTNITSPGVYSVIVGRGCCSVTDTIKVLFDSIKSRFSVAPTIQCLGSNKYEFQNETFSDFPFKSFWDFGDGTSDTATNAIHTFNQRRTYQVVLRVTSANGCISEFRRFALTLFDPVAGFSVNNTDQCFNGQSFRFEDTSYLRPGNGIISGIEFDFDDGTKSTDTIVNKTFAKGGLYNVKLKVLSSVGCSDSMTIPVRVIEPFAGFTISDTLICETGNNITLDDTSVLIGGTTATTLWKFGNGETRVDTAQFNYSYPTSGNYDLRLISSTPEGCKDSVSRLVIIKPSPKPGFTINQNIQCFNENEFLFTDTSKINSGIIDTVIWHYGNASIKQDQWLDTNKYSYSSHGVYQVKLYTSTLAGCSDSIIKQVEVLASPNANFIIDKDEQCFRENFFTFNAASTSIPEGNNSGFSWDYGDTSTANGITSSKRYNYPDSFLVSFRVVSDRGCPDTIKKLVKVNPTPTLQYQVNNPNQCFNENNFAFAGLANVSRGSISQTFWDLGDGNIKNGLNISHQFQEFGPYSIKFYAVSDAGCADTLFNSVNVRPSPTNEISVNDSQQCFGPHLFQFDAFKSKIADGSIIAYNWDFDDDSALLSGPGPFQKSFAIKRPHLIRLVTASDQNCYDTAFMNAGFYETASINVNTNNPEQCFEGNEFGFNANLTTIPSGWVKDYYWEFGDGSQATGIAPPLKKYNRPDTFTIKLKVTSNEGCSDSAYFGVRVNPNPRADFTVNEVCLKQASSFNDRTYIETGKIIDWNWEFGDNKKSNVPNPMHHYGKYGEFTVKLTVVSDKNCPSTSIKPDIAVVKQIPIADFESERMDYNTRMTTMKFTDKSKDPISWSWDFGNGKYSNDPNPEIDFSDTGNYPINLIVQNAEGCYDTIEKKVFVYPGFIFFIPNAFTPNGGTLNESFGPVSTAYFQRYEMKIFNRWGIQVFETKTPNQGWDGTYLGEPCQMDTYLYLFNVVDLDGNVKQYKGTFTLIR